MVNLHRTAVKTTSPPQKQMCHSHVSHFILYCTDLHYNWLNKHHNMPVIYMYYSFSFYCFLFFLSLKIKTENLKPTEKQTAWIHMDHICVAVFVPLPSIVSCISVVSCSKTQVYMLVCEMNNWTALYSNIYFYSTYVCWSITTCFKTYNGNSTMTVVVDIFSRKPRHISFSELC